MKKTNPELYVITGINRLTGERENISSPMERVKCEIKIAISKYKRNKPFLKLRIEHWPNKPLAINPS